MILGDLRIPTSQRFYLTQESIAELYKNDDASALSYSVALPLATGEIEETLNEANLEGQSSSTVLQWSCVLTRSRSRMVLDPFNGDTTFKSVFPTFLRPNSANVKINESERA
jgi:hypothetical protein